MTASPTARHIQHAILDGVEYIALTKNVVTPGFGRVAPIAFHRVCNAFSLPCHCLSLSLHCLSLALSHSASLSLLRNHSALSPCQRLGSGVKIVHAVSPPPFGPGKRPLLKLSTSRLTSLSLFRQCFSLRVSPSFAVFPTAFPFCTSSVFPCPFYCPFAACFTASRCIFHCLSLSFRLP